MSDFFAMGGYAAYVWSGFALTAIVMVGNAVWSGQRERGVRRAIRGRIRREAARGGQS